MIPPSPTNSKTQVVPPQAEPPVLESQDIISSLPAPIFRLLVIFAGPISHFRTISEVLCWNPNRRVESWIMVGIWWAVCLGAGHAFRWLLPALLFLPLVPLSQLKLGNRETKKDGGSAGQSTTTESVLLTLNDLHSIQALLPPSPIPDISSIYARFRQLGPLRLTRGLGVIWTTWIILGHIIGFRALLAIIGSIVLLLPSPTLAHIVDLLSKSLVVRRIVALLFLFTFGSPPEHSYRLSLDFSPLGWVQSKWAASRRPSLAFAFKPTFDKKAALNGSAIVDDDDEKEENPIYFRFEVHENHRWWMGLDWTSALLPQERPSWCDSHLLPVSPPASFSLPPPASIILPAPTKSDPHAKVKRTATWKWLDDDWSIVRAGQSGSTPITVTAPSPVPESESTFSHIPRSLSISLGSAPQDDGPRTQSIAEQAFTKGLERLKARTITPQGKQTSPRSSVEMVRPRTGSGASEDLEGVQMQGMTGAANPVSHVPTETIREQDHATDAEGWVYGDNKWENMGPKGGLGRFTRRRRWHRRAVCTEVVQKLPSSTAQAQPPPLKADPVVSTIPVLSTATTGMGFTVDSITAGPSALIPDNGVRDDVLRQRLKKAMGSMGG